MVCRQENHGEITPAALSRAEEALEALRQVSACSVQQARALLSVFKARASLPLPFVVAVRRRSVALFSPRWKARDHPNPTTFVTLSVHE